MLKYIFKQEWFKLIKNKYISLLKISGLVIGLWVFMVSGYYILHELSFDHFQEQANNKYSIEYRESYGDDYFSFSLPYPLTDSLQNNYPEVKTSIAFESKENTIYIETPNGYTTSKKNKIAFVEENFFNFFNFDFILGDVHNSFSIPNPIIISEEIARHHFNGSDAMGKLIKLRIDNKFYEFIITGIIKNPPGNSNVGFHWIASLSHYMKNAGNYQYASDLEFKCKCFIELWPGTYPDQFLSKLSEDYNRLAKLTYEPNIVATPITKLHIDKNVAKRLKIFTALGILILIISVVNYILLSTVEKTQQIKQLAIEKITGAKQIHFIVKNLISILIYSILSFGITIVAFIITKPYFPIFFKGVSDSNLDTSIVTYSLIGAIIFILVSTVFITQIIHVDQKPIDILKNKFVRGKTRKFVFNSLLIFQLIAFIVLISCSVFIHKQLVFMQESKLGFNQESLIIQKIAPEDVHSYHAYKTELKKHPSIINVGASSAPPLSGQLYIYGFIFTDSLGNQQFKSIEYANIDRDFFKTLELKFKEGTDFPESSADYCVVNQAFIDERKIEHPMEDKVELGGKEYHICAILEDFHQSSMHSAINPFVAYLNPNQITYALIRYTGHPHKAIALLKNNTEKYLPNTIFEYDFMDEKIKSSYLDEARFSNIIRILTILSILIAVLGLLGLSHFSSLMKIKEIGIRKVNGAKTTEIMTMLNKDIFKWVVVSFIIATPIAYYIMHKWLENFAYKTTLSWWIFVGAGIAALSIVLLTVSLQSWRAATRNPVEALRYE